MNEQINIEYTISYVYHALHSYFARDNVGLPGFAKFFSEASEEERGHAQLLMDYQVKRGGRVELKVCLRQTLGVKAMLPTLCVCCLLIADENGNPRFPWLDSIWSPCVAAKSNLVIDGIVN